MRSRNVVLGGLVVTAGAFLLLNGCGSSGATGSLPMVTPPVRAAAPAGFTAGTRGDGRALSSADIQSRFFATGPTSILGILTAIDQRITDINNRSGSAACLTQTPVAYTVSPWGQTVTLYGQCYEILSGATASDPKLVQWGQKDGVTYLYYAVGAQRVAVIATPNAGGGGTYRVQAWLGLGYTNATCGTGFWDSCSYGVMHLDADSSASTFELAVAGMGFGYCGAQVRSDGTNVYVEGSVDMGTTCNAIDTTCVLAANIATAGTCGPSLTTFALPSIGRHSATGSPTPPINGGTHAASLFPGTGPNVTVNGTLTDALYFGPTTQTTGVGPFP